MKEYKLQRTEHSIPVKGYDLHVRVQEIGKGLPPLYIHGGPNAGSTWLELSSHLQDFRCIMLDRPGCGLGEGLSYRSMTRDQLDELIIIPR